MKLLLGSSCGTILALTLTTLSFSGWHNNNLAQPIIVSADAFAPTSTSASASRTTRPHQQLGSIRDASVVLSLQGGSNAPWSSFPMKQSKKSSLSSTSNNASSVNGGNAASSPSKQGPLNELVSASFLIFLDIAFRKLFQTLNISFPSSLAGCCALLITCLVMPFGSQVYKTLNPGASLLAKWLPVFFVPSLITLPLVGSIGPPSEVMKILAVIVVGFYFTLLTTAGSVVGIRKLFSPPTTETGTNENADMDPSMSSSPPTISTDTNTPTPKSPPPLPFSKSLVYQLRTIMAATGIYWAILPTKPLQGPIYSLFLLTATLHHFVLGARLPAKFKKTVHPLVTCTALTWTMAGILAKISGTTFTKVLRSYKTGILSWNQAGPGDMLLFLLGPAVVSLAMSMYEKRNLVRENWKEVVTAVGVSSMGGLFGTAAMVRCLNLASPSLRLSLLSRNITSPLAMAIASILGANVGLAVAMVVVTGLIGANFGAGILSWVGLHDPVARGLGIGAAAHGLGTAAFVDEKDAFPFAGMSMALTATACTCLVSVPAIKKAVLKLALGGV